MLLPANAKVIGLIPLYVVLKALKGRNYILVKILLNSKPNFIFLNRLNWEHPFMWDVAISAVVKQGIKRSKVWGSWLSDTAEGERESSQPVHSLVKASLNVAALEAED